MLAKDMFEFRGYMQKRGIIFCYSGYMTEDVLTSIGNAIRKKMELEQADKKISKGLFSVFVEQVQNVIRYSVEGEALDVGDAQKELRYGVLTVGKLDGQYFVSCGNMVMKTDVDRLSSALEHIQMLDKDGLKTLYKQTLKGETPEGSKGAGVGFIDIARRARSFKHDFSDIDADHSYFCLEAFI